METKRVLQFVAVLMASIFIMSCNNSRKLAKQQIGTEIDMPCHGKKYRSDNRYLLSSQTGTSSDISFSKEKALLKAKRKLSTLVEPRMKSVTRRYANEKDIADKHQFEQKMENETREAVKTTLRNVDVVCEKTHVLEDGLFRTFMAVAVNREKFMDNLNDRISREEELKLEYDQERFREIYEEEMKNLDEQRSF